MITQPSDITVMATASTISCYGGTANIHINAVGGTPSYTGTGNYTVTAGTHIFTVTDNSGCTASRTVIVNQPQTLNAYASSSGISCFGQRASIVVSATGGTPPFSGIGTYSVPAGPYTYYVTDANGCTAGVGIIINEPPLLTVAASVLNPLTCNGGTGTVSVTAQGGTVPYTGTGVFTQSAGTTTYSVIDNNGCQAGASITFAQGASITGRIIVTNATCTTPGSATASVSGGSTPYSYLWSNGATGVTASGLPPGSYSLTVTDQNGCSSLFNCTVRLNAVYPGLAGSITGQTNVRTNSTFTYSILPVSGATSYRWTLPPNCSGFSTSTSININFMTGFSGGSICVTPVNACGDGGTSCKAVVIPTITGTGGPGKVKDKIPVGLGNGLGAIISADQAAGIDPGSSGVSPRPFDAGPGGSADPSLTLTASPDAIRNLVVYPNPSRGKVVIGFNGKKDEIYFLQLLDMSGAVIAELKVKGQEDMCQILYDTSILAAGIYNLSVINSDESQRRSIKLVIQ
jgi:hypothetical protein